MRIISIICRFSLTLGLIALLGSAHAAEAAAAAPSDALKQAALELENGRLYFSGAALGADVGASDIHSDNVRDYTFSTAPTDWIARSGQWNATNRWTCSPQWSWYGGYSPDGVAAFWNKRQFMGDVTVELYSAFKMRLNRDPTYLHPRDINITICGDGANLDSGYSFIIGGDENRWTRIMRGTRVIAETRDPKGLWPIYENGQPATYEWHRKWWSLRVRKTGPKLQIYFDENLVLEGTDPAPLPGGRVALWVLKEDLITPRIKIYYEKEKTPRDPMPVAPSALAARTVVAEPQITVTSATHPSVQNDFENDLGRFAPRDEDQGAVCSLTSGGPDGSGNCLQLTNRAAGGSFGANVLDQRFDAAQLPQLSFDYKLFPDVKTNFYLTCGDQQYEIVFSGMKAPAPGCTLLGAIPDVSADGKWHHATFDLLGALQTVQGLTAPTICSDLWVGNQSNEGYLLAGFGGNHASAKWYLDNLALRQARGAKLELSMTPRPGAEVDGYSVLVDSNPHGLAPEKVTTKESSFKTDLVGEGLRYAHVKPLLKGGKWGSNVNYAVAADATAPTIAGTDPAPGSPLREAPLTLKVQDPGGSALNLNSLKLTLGKLDLTAASPGVRYDPQQALISVEPKAAGLVLNDGDRVALAVTGLSDRAGNALAAPLSYTFGMDFKSYKTSIPAPKVQINGGYLCDDDFESGLGQWTTWGQAGGAVLSRDSSTANSGQYSLKLYNPKAGGRFGAYVTQTPFDAGKYRLISFAYKCDDRLRADLAVYVNGDWKGIKFTDNDNDLGVIGEVPNVQADNKWHTATINLYDMLRRDEPQMPTFMVRMFVIADWGWAGNRPGATYNLDDFQLIPVISGAQPVKVAWGTPDVTGVAGASWLLDTQAATAPPTTALSGTGAEAAINCSTLSDGWLHLRVQDRAGNWSAPASRRLLVDSEIPSASLLSPAVGDKNAVSLIELHLSDNGLAGVDPSSVRLKVAGTDYVMDGAALKFLPAEGKLVWNCEEVLPSPVVFPDGKQVDVELIAAADYAGNAAQQLPKWSWTMDYSADHKAPVVSEIQSTTHPTLLSQTFEDGQALWANRDGKNGAAVALDSTTAASGKNSLKLTNQTAGGHMQATVTRTAYDVEKYPVVSFDYKIPAATKLAFSVFVRDKWYAITLNDAATDVIGRVPGIVADDKWRHASVDLMPLLRRQQANGPLLVENIVIGDRNTMDNAAGANAWFDNFVIGQVGKYPPVLRWRATDTTGIKAFSYVLDQNAATVPDETSEGMEVAKSFDAMNGGVWWFHIRAQDGAGNWGPATTYAVLHLKSD
jgi:hypothetical protein